MTEWISTGKAAALLGYGRTQFIEKFEGCIPAHRLPGGHRRWLLSAVIALVDPPPALDPTG